MYLTINRHKTFARAYLRRRRQESNHSTLLCDAFTSHLQNLWASLPVGSTIAAFLPLPTEPPIAKGLALADQAGHKILVPAVLPKRRLGWARWSPATPLNTNSLGISEPQGEKLGSEAFINANLRLIPALAYDMLGNRLGQGGGYYDSILELLPARTMDTSTLGVVFSHEILDGLPHAEWDATLNYVLTEHGIQQLGMNVQNRVQ